MQNIWYNQHPHHVRWGYARFKALDLARHFDFPPVDPIAIIKKYKWKIVNLNFPEEAYRIEAVTTPYYNNRYAVFVDPWKKIQYPARYRFSLSHEIGHVVLGHYDTYNLSLLSKSEKAILDREADEFAGEFLVPKTLLKRVKIIDIDRLAEVFQVSHEVMRIRLQRHNMLKKNTYI